MSYIQSCQPITVKKQDSGHPPQINTKLVDDVKQHRAMTIATSSLTETFDLFFPLSIQEYSSHGNEIKPYKEGESQEQGCPTYMWSQNVCFV